MLKNKVIKGLLIVLYLILYIYTIFIVRFESGEGTINMALHIGFTFGVKPILGSIILFSFIMSLYLPLKALKRKICESRVNHNLTFFQIIFTIIVLIYLIFSFFNYHKYNTFNGRETPILLLILSIAIIGILVLLGLYDRAINRYSFKLFNGLILLSVFDSLILLEIYIDINNIIFCFLFGLILTISLYIGLYYYKYKCYRLGFIYLYILNVILAVINLAIDILGFHFHYIITLIMLGLTIIDLLIFLVAIKYYNSNMSMS